MLLATPHAVRMMLAKDSLLSASVISTAQNLRTAAMIFTISANLMVRKIK